MSKNLYDLLGLSKSATDDEIRNAYRKLAKELHPDLNPGNKEAEERFKAVSSAFSILGDSEKRERYDKGEIDDAGAERPETKFYRHYADSDAQHHYHSSHGYEDFVDLGDLFAEAFFHARQADGTTQQRSTPLRGGDVRYRLAIDFLDAANGATKRIEMPDNSMLDVSIPAGVDDGQTLRLKGKGLPGHYGGPNGDALVAIEVRPHPVFHREGNDIVVDLPIGIHEAVLGSKIEVPTTTGRVMVTIPKGATSGQVLRLRGQGIRSNKGNGDQLVRLTIAMPTKIDAELQEFIEAWAENNGYNPRQNMEQAQ